MARLGLDGLEVFPHVRVLKHHIAHAELGQVIGDRAADDAATDDDNMGRSNLSGMHWRCLDFAARRVLPLGC